MKANNNTKIVLGVISLLLTLPLITAILLAILLK